MATALEENTATRPVVDTRDATEFDDLRWRLLGLLIPSAALIAVCWHGTFVWLELPIIGWTAYFFLCQSSLFHEYAHRHNHLRCRIWARIIGTFILIPATAYRETHVRHHAYLNRPVDWELWPYSDPRCSRSFRRLFAWFDLLAGYLSSPIIYGRIYWHSRSPLSSRARRAIGWEYAELIAFWSAALVVIALTDQWSGFLRAWVLPWWIAGILQTGRKFTEHLGMSSYDPLHGTRTVYGGGWLTRVCSYLNSDIFIHGPHHRSPRVTADELHAFATQLRAASANGFYDSYGAAIKDMLPHLLQNPGVGENAGLTQLVPQLGKQASVEA